MTERVGSSWAFRIAQKQSWGGRGTGEQRVGEGLTPLKGAGKRRMNGGSEKGGSKLAENTGSK